MLSLILGYTAFLDLCFLSIIYIQKFTGILIEPNLVTVISYNREKEFLYNDIKSIVIVRHSDVKHEIKHEIKFNKNGFNCRRVWRYDLAFSFFDVKQVQHIHFDRSYTLYYDKEQYFLPPINFTVGLLKEFYKYKKLPILMKYEDFLTNYEFILEAIKPACKRNIQIQNDGKIVIINPQI